MNLITSNKRNHVSLDAVWEFENAILTTRNPNLVIRRKPLLDLFLKILNKLNLDSLFYWVIKTFSLKNTNNFAVLMGPYFEKCIPYMFSKGIMAYIFMIHGHPNILILIR